MTKPRTWTEWREQHKNGVISCIAWNELDLAGIEDKDETFPVRVTEILPDEVERARKVVEGFDEDNISRTSVRFFQKRKHIDIDSDGGVQLDEDQLEAMLTLLRVK